MYEEKSIGFTVPHFGGINVSSKRPVAVKETTVKSKSGRITKRRKHRRRLPRKTK